MSTQRFTSFDWVLVAAALEATLEVSRPAGKYVTLTERSGRRISVHDNGGEFNTVVREADGATERSPDFSVAYMAWSLPIGPLTLAYRIRCHADDVQVDYDIDLDAWNLERGRVEGLRAIADMLESGAWSVDGRAELAGEWSVKLFESSSNGGVVNAGTFVKMLVALGVPRPRAELDASGVVLRSKPARLAALKALFTNW